MRKFSQILESKEELLSRISVTDDEIEEMLIDLIDLGYYHISDSIYISTKTGHIHRRKKDSKEYYPGLEININRNIDDDKGDYRNWDGGVYFEDDLSILDAIYNSIHRVKSMLGDRGSIYYSIRNVNDIQIRIVFDKESSGTLINYEMIEDTIKDLEIFKSHVRQDGYGDLDGTRVNGYYIDFNQSWRRPGGDIYELKMAVGTDDSIESSVKEGHTNNKSEMWINFKLWCNKFLNKVNPDHNLKLKPITQVVRGKSKSGFVIVDKDNPDVVLIDIICWYEDQETRKVITEKGGFLKKEKVVEYEIYELYFRVKIIELDK